MAVFVGVLVSAAASKAHLNPAVPVGLAAAGKFAWDKVPFYVLARSWACVGLLVWIQYRPHFDATTDPT